MHPFTSNRTRSRTAFTLLLVWLFALGSGCANACLLQTRGTQSHVSPTEALPSPQALKLNVLPGHLGMDDGHPDYAGAAKGICLKVCDDGTRSIVEQASGFDVPHVAMAPPLTLPWRSPLAAAAAHHAWLELPAPSTGLPLRTRLSRLAL